MHSSSRPARQHRFAVDDAGADHQVSSSDENKPPQMSSAAMPDNELPFKEEGHVLVIKETSSESRSTKSATSSVGLLLNML